MRNGSPLMHAQTSCVGASRIRLKDRSEFVNLLVAEAAKNGGAMARVDRSAVGGLVVATGYAEERLGYLAALLSEALPKALWAPLPQELYDGGRELRLALSHLVAGTTVIQLAKTDRQVVQFRDLAEGAGARFLHVLSTPPSALGDTPDPPAASDAANPASAERVFVQASASLTTQLEVVLAAWKRL